MRNEFVAAVTRRLKDDQHSLFLTGDLGYDALEPLRGTIGSRFLNVGIAEQNMIGVASGMALAGFKPWVYSIVPFLVYRPLEQIRNDLCYHNLPVRLVGNGGGFTYGIMGSTHHGLEDLGILKTLPNMTLFFPCDGAQVAEVVDSAGSLAGPAYIRLARNPFARGDKPLSQNQVTLTRQYSQGSRATLVGVGHAIDTLLAAVRLLKQVDFDIFSISQFPLKPDIDHDLWRSMEKTGRVIVMEEHYASGSIAESLKMAAPKNVHFELLAPKYDSKHLCGKHDYLLEQAELGPSRISELLGAM